MLVRVRETDPYSTGSFALGATPAGCQTFRVKPQQASYHIDEKYQSGGLATLIISLNGVHTGLLGFYIDIEGRSSGYFWG